MSQSGGNGKASLTARRFLTLTLMKALLDLMQARLAHDPGQAKQRPVVVGAGIVETLAIGDDDAEERAPIEELMPIAIVAGGPGGVEAYDRARMARSDLGGQLPEARPLDGPGSGFAQILINDMHALMRPAESDGAVDEAVLPTPCFLDGAAPRSRKTGGVNVGELAAMRGSDTFVRAIRCSHHADPP